jgi:MoaA/NifB/PqqE/SkfB family radical SAM enzyme/Fe-S-cluster containining protein
MKRKGVSKIYYTGGDPFFRSDFAEILSETYACGISAEVITNGTLLTEEKLSLLAAFGVPLGISLDGDTPEVNDAIRGKGSFAKAVNAIQKARRLSIPVRLYVTVMSANVRCLEGIAALVKQYDCDGMHVNEVTLAGRALSSPRVEPLSLNDHDLLPELVGRIADKFYEEKLQLLEEGCWIDKESAWYMQSNGNIYACSEIALRRPSQFRGNVLDFVAHKRTSLRQAQQIKKSESCCYLVWASAHVTLTLNTWEVCPMTRSHRAIDTLEQLYEELDQFYPDIRQFCKECEYPDCMGYIWALTKEADKMVEEGIVMVEINDNANFIHSFAKNPDGSLNVEARYPVCRYLKGPCRRCGIHSHRPMVCRLWPIGFETHERKVVLALHLDCLYVQYLQEHKLVSRFKRHALGLMARLTPRLKGEILSTYHAVDEIATFPYGENRYFVLQEFSKKGECRHV